MSVKIAIIAIGTIIALVGGGVAIKYTIFKSTPEIPAAFSAILKANGVSENTTVPYGSAINLEWESKNAARCFASGDWSGILPASGSQTIENIDAPKNFQIKCVNDKNEVVLSSIITRVDENTIPSLSAQTIGKDFFKDFAYTWVEIFCFNAKNKQDVAALQTVLFLEGFFESAEKITGDFNEETAIALKKFQVAYDVDQSGCADQKTISKLNELYGIEILAYSSPSPSYSSSGKTSQQKLINGFDFQINDFVKTTATINLRNDNCREIGTIAAGTLLKIISPEIKYCVIGNKKFRMRKVQVADTGQIGWLAAAYLEKVSIAASGGNGENNSGNNNNPAPAIILKANGIDGSITVPPGSSAILSWISTNTISCEASGSWSGQKQTSGQESTGNINDYKTYILQCRGNNNFYVTDSLSVSPSLSASNSSTNNTPPQETPKIDKINPNKWDVNPFCVPAIALTVNIKGLGFAPHDNELDTGWGAVIKNLDSKDGKDIVAKIKVNDDLIKKVQKEKYKVNYATFKWKIINANGTSNEKDFVAFSSCPMW